MKPSPTALGLGLPLLLVFSSGDEWPHWMGPDRNNISKETGWAIEGKADPVWSNNVGIGYSSFAIADGKLFTLGYDEEMGMDLVFCLDADTGEEIWSYAYPSQIWDRAHGGGTLTTPTIDGKHVYTSNREGRLFCFNAADGEIVWDRQQKEDLDLEYPTWGFSASPLILDDRLIMNLGRVVAYHKTGGDIEWETERNYGHAYSTPAVFEYEGERCLAVYCSDGLAVLREKDGAELFFQEWKEERARVNAMTPIVVGNKIFVSSGYNRGCCVIEIGKEGSRIVWESKAMRSHMTGPVFYEGHLYGFDDNVLKCLDLDGKELWRERGLGKGALVMADGKLILNSSDGELIVAQASPEAFKELSRTTVLDGGVYWTSPVLVNGRIYCRNSLGDIVCRDHRAAD